MAQTNSLVELLEQTCERHERLPALGYKSGARFEWLTYGQLRQQVAQARRVLISLGVGASDRVAIIANNCPRWAELCYATAGCGAVFVPMYAAQTPAEWAYILNDSGAKICFTGTPKIHEALIAQRGNFTHNPRLLCLEDTTDGIDCLSPMLVEGAADSAPPFLPQPSQIAAIIYTSGTTGRPKGVVLSHGNITSNAASGCMEFAIDASDRSLSFLPWAHAFGQTVDLHLLLGKGVAIAINDDIANLLSNLATARPTVLVAVPRVFNRIHDVVKRQIRRRNRLVRGLFQAGLAAATRQARGDPLSLGERAAYQVANRLLFARIRNRFGGCLRFAICGSAALSQDVAEFVNALGIEIYEGYGLTEASPVVSVNTPRSRRFGTVGRPLQGVSVVIAPTGQEDPRQGEVLVRGPNVMQGYYNLPQDTSEVLLPDGSLRTGDLGYLDEAGHLVICGRIKEQYKLENGKYVAPAPIEERLRGSTLIANCVVCGADRPYNVALVVPNLEGLRQRIEADGLYPLEGREDPRIHRHIVNEVRSLSTELRPFERPRRVALADQDFTIDNGLLTPSFKPRRGEIIRRYHAQLDALYPTDSRSHVTPGMD